MIEAALKPTLKKPFPNTPDLYKCPITGLEVPKKEVANLEYKERILSAAEYDTVLQNELMAMSAESILFWINTFVWTFHQFDAEGDTGKRYESENVHVPFITWEVQDDLFDRFQWHLKNAQDILINKTREMGASWCCTAFLHWLWLFHPNAQLLELSRTEPYVDETGNMKALFQKHDYINDWLPGWMVPPLVGQNQKYRRKMHMFNSLNGACIDGESTTEHAASGDRRLVTLLDEFAKVKHGQLMRSATRDASLMRIVNSTVAGPGTEYSQWKNSGKITVFPLMWWDHPDKGKNRYAEQEKITGAWKIRSPWYNLEETIRSPREMAREIDANDLEAGSTYFTVSNIEKHIVLFGCEPKSRWTVDLDSKVPNDAVKRIVKMRDIKKVSIKRNKNGPLRVWINLINGRPDQSKDYIFGIDLSKGQGASNSVVSIKCRQTGEKIVEWRDANTPPYELARIVMALAIWCGGRKKKLPLLKWEMNGPGWDFGSQVVKKFHYPYYYRNIKPGNIRDKKTKKYGWHSNKTAKDELLTAYDRALAHGGFISHSIWGLQEAKTYIYYPGGGIGPACMVEENESARKTHGDVVIADALTIEDKYLKVVVDNNITPPAKSIAYRKKMAMERKKKPKGWRKPFDFRSGQSGY